MRCRGLRADRGQRIGCASGAAEAPDRCPNVRFRRIYLRWCPVWELETEVVCHRAGVRLVEPAQGVETCAYVDIAAEGDAGLAQQIAQMEKLVVVEPREGAFA